MTTPTLSKAEVGAELADLRRTVEGLVTQTPEGRATAEAAAEHARLRTLAEAGHAEAEALAATFTPRLARWRTRGEAAVARLPNRGNSPEAMAFDRQMPAAEAACRALPDEWARIRAALDAEGAHTRLSAIAAMLQTARGAVHTLPRLRDGVRRLVADLEHIVTLEEA